MLRGCGSSGMSSLNADPSLQSSLPPVPADGAWTLDFPLCHIGRPNEVLSSLAANPNGTRKHVSTRAPQACWAAPNNPPVCYRQIALSRLSALRFPFSVFLSRGWLLALGFRPARDRTRKPKNQDSPNHACVTG